MADSPQRPAAAPPGAAAAAVAKRRVKRAMGLLRQASAALAPDAGGFDVVAEVKVHRGGDRDELDALLALNLERYGELDVVILTRPR